MADVDNGYTLEGSLQMVVNLRSPSVEYVRDRDYPIGTHVLKGDVLTLKEIVEQIVDSGGEIDDDTLRDQIADQLGQLAEFVKNFKNLNYLQITVLGTPTFVHPEDISFVRIVTTGEIKKIADRVL